MQRQLDKMTDLLQLVVQKMEINTEIVIDDRSKCDNNDKRMSQPRLRQTLNVVRRLHHLRPTMSSHASDHN